jgi:hypothetical protein
MARKIKSEAAAGAAYLKKAGVPAANGTKRASCVHMGDNGGTTK